MKFLKLPAICLASLAALIQIPAATAGDDEVTFIPSIGYQHKRLKFEQEYNTVGGSGTADFDVELPTINASLTAGYRRIFVTAKYEKSLGDTTTEANEVQPTTSSYYLNIPGGLTSVDREDMSLTVGYNVISALNIFVGYMKGKTSLKPEIGCVFVAPESTCDTNTNPAGLSNLAFLHNYFGATSAYEQTYEEEGPYIGLSYAWQIAEAGSLSFSAAYAKMDGEYRDNYAAVANEDFKYTGDSTGTSYGLTWTAPLGENSNYFIDVRKQKYDMDAEDDNGNFPGSAVKTVETMTGLTAGVQFYF